MMSHTSSSAFPAATSSSARLTTTAGSRGRTTVRPGTSTNARSRSARTLWCERSSASSTRPEHGGLAHAGGEETPLKITGIETISVALPARRLHRMAFPSEVLGRYVIVRMFTDEGIEGLGEATVMK